MRDWEDPMKSWVSGALNHRVFSGFPLGTPVWPVVVMTRLGGVPDGIEDVPRARFRVWADKKSVASAVLYDLTNILEQADGRPTPMGQVTMLATTIDLIQWAPDESLGDKPSYIMDATLVFISP